MQKLLFVLLAGVLLTGCSGAATSPDQDSHITQVISFGDDFTNTENCYQLFKEAVAQGQMDASELDVFENVNWKGRLTNGPVAVEVMAEKLNVDLKNYAVCAATSGQDSIQFSDAGLLGQVDKFESELKGKKADPRALYFIQIPITDFYLEGRPADDVTVIDNIKIALSRLAELGAKHFMIGNTLNLDNFPGFIRESMANRAEQYYVGMNTKLPGELEKLAQELKTEIEIFDLAAIAKQIQSNPEQYGLKQLESPCTDLPYESGPVCENPDEYYYWGYYYLTRVVHKAIGEAMAEQVSK